MQANPHGWTGGQASLVRILVGTLAFAWCAGSLVRLAQVGGPPIDFVLLAAGLPLSVMVAVGWMRRLAAVALAGTIFVLHEAYVVVPRDTLPAFEAVLLLVALWPSAPYGALAARGRVDPAGGWVLPTWWVPLAWTLFVVAYVVVALVTHPDEPPSVIMLVLLSGVFTRYRMLAWLALTAFDLGWLAATGVDPSRGAIALHLVTFIPAWVPPPDSVVTQVFYDGGCGLCHRSVRLLMAEDVDGAHFRFAPLDGPTFEEMVPAAERAELPDSIVVRTGTGRILSRSRAVRYCLARLGGLWRVIGIALGCVPPPLLDLAYDGVARIRHRLFETPTDACPVVPEHLRDRLAP